jgi:hypothetical protein
MASPINQDTLYDLAIDCEIHFNQLRHVFVTVSSKQDFAQLCAGFEQRFAMWAAHQGVFARKGQSLDRRLRKYPDIQDLGAIAFMT